MIWLSVKEVGNLECITESAVKKRLKKAIAGKDYRRIQSSTGQGGRKLEINLSFLSEQAQKAYHNEQGECQTVFNTDYTYTKSQREKGEKKSLVVTEFRKYEQLELRNGLKGKTKIKKAFVLKWNMEHPQFQITLKSLYEWLKISKTGNVEKLIDKRGGYNRGQSTIPKKYQDYFLSIYLQLSRPSVESCFKETQLKANLNGDEIPKIKAFRNLADNLDKTIVIRAREGRKAFEDKCMPTMERDYSLLEPNEIWVADHHLWDIFVRVPDGKGGWKAERPWGSYWMDMRTRKIVSSFIRTESPNSDIVLLSFKSGVRDYGIPQRVYLDNGKDYKAKDMFYPEGHILDMEKENEKVYSSLARNLQIAVTYAIPYNARAKPIERVFNTFEEQLGKKYPSYAGSNAKVRPEDLKDLDIMNMITLEEFVEQHRRYVYEIYNESPHTGDSMNGKSPNYMYHSIKFIPNVQSPEVLYFALMRVKGMRTIGKEGIVFNNTRYINEKYQNYFGRKITARYDPEKPDILYIFDVNENFLFEATKKKKYGFALSDEDYQEANHSKKIARQAALNNYTPNNDIRSTESIRERLKCYSESIEKAPVADHKIINVVRNEKLEETARRIDLSEIERNYEDVLKQQTAKKLEVNSRQKELADNFKKNMLERAYQNQA